jgi:hypothetical protein
MDDRGLCGAKIAISTAHNVPARLRKPGPQAFKIGGPPRHPFSGAQKQGRNASENLSMLKTYTRETLPLSHMFAAESPTF